jgi:hypothetical protein
VASNIGHARRHKSVIPSRNPQLLGETSGTRNGLSLPGLGPSSLPPALALISVVASFGVARRSRGVGGRSRRVSALFPHPASRARNERRPRRRTNNKTVDGVRWCNHGSPPYVLQSPTLRPSGASTTTRRLHLVSGSSPTNRSIDRRHPPLSRTLARSRTRCMSAPPPFIWAGSGIAPSLALGSGTSREAT